MRSAGTPSRQRKLARKKKAWGKGKMRSYWSPEELVTTRTQRHRISWKKRSAKGVVREAA